MTPEQIKALAKQAGGTAYVNRHYQGETAMAFGPVALNEFVRLVRKQALEERFPVALRADESSIYAKGKSDGRKGAMADLRELLGVTKENLE